MITYFTRVVGKHQCFIMGCESRATSAALYHEKRRLAPLCPMHFFVMSESDAHNRPNETEVSDIPAIPNIRRGHQREER